MKHSHWPESPISPFCAMCITELWAATELSQDANENAITTTNKIVLLFYPIAILSSCDRRPHCSMLACTSILDTLMRCCIHLSQPTGTFLGRALIHCCSPDGAELKPCVPQSLMQSREQRTTSLAEQRMSASVKIKRRTRCYLGQFISSHYPKRLDSTLSIRDHLVLGTGRTRRTGLDLGVRLTLLATVVSLAQCNHTNHLIYHAAAIATVLR